MRMLTGHPFDHCRFSDSRTELLFDGFPEHLAGAFVMPGPLGPLHVIASTSEGWDHVSVSRPDRAPYWSEMEWVFRTFFLPSETAMQLHVPASEHVNCHPNCLHMWAPKSASIPRPPKRMV